MNALSDHQKIKKNNIIDTYTGYMFYSIQTTALLWCLSIITLTIISPLETFG